MTSASNAALAPLDWAVICTYGAAVLAIGYAARRGHEGAGDLLLGRRQVPTWAVLCSMSATELSAATFIGVPQAAFVGDWSFLELAFGALLGKLVVSARVLPRYHALGVVTVYQLLERRFGRRSQRVAALCFLGGRLLASGVRLFIAALAFSAVTGARIEIAIVATGVVAGLYTRAGGIRSVIWTDTLQAAVLLVGGVALLVAGLAAVDGGWEGMIAWADANGRSGIFTTTPLFALADTRPFGTALAGGFFLTLATHSTDHDMVQRLLSARSARAAGWALCGSAIVNFPLTLLFLAIGTAIACSQALGGTAAIEDATRVVPSFALAALPAGLRGLVYAGLFAAAMSSLDSAICAMAATWTVDVAPRAGDDPATARRMRGASALFALLLVGSALGMSVYHTALGGTGGGLVDLALSSMTILYGGLLGVFAVALATRRSGCDAGAVAGLAVGGALGLALFLHPLLVGEVLIAWTWWIPIAATPAAAIAIAWPAPGAARIR